MSIFTPGASFLNHFTFAKKFTLIGSVALAVAGFLLWQVYGSLTSQIEASKRELSGLEAQALIVKGALAMPVNSSSSANL